MNSILLSTSNGALYGLRDMLSAAIGQHEYVCPYVDVPVALMLIEIAKRAPDRDEWFPRGKWATIQAIQAAVNCELDKLLWHEPPPIKETR